MANALQSSHYTTDVYTLNFHCDWSDTTEFMDIAILVSDGDLHEDFIFASGKTIYARDFVKSLFLEFGLDYKNHLKEINQGVYVPADWCADISKMKRFLGCQPVVPIYNTCLKILETNYGYDCKR